MNKSGVGTGWRECPGAGTDVLTGILTTAGADSGYWQTSPILLQFMQVGMFSWHFTFLLLQLKHPRRDLVWPFRGMGLRRALVFNEALVLGELADVCWAESGVESGTCTVLSAEGDLEVDSGYESSLSSLSMLASSIRTGL